MHTHMNRRNSFVDWVLSHWAYFTVVRFIFVYVCIFVFFYRILYILVLLHGEVDLMGLKPDPS